MGQIVVTGPNRAAVITGGRKYKFVIGDWAVAWWCLSRGVFITVNAVALCKVARDERALLLASELFTGYSIPEMKTIISQTLEGHLMSVVGAMSIEEIYTNLHMVAVNVKIAALDDLRKMGIDLKVLTIAHVCDHSGHIAALGRVQIASVKYAAVVSVAEAKRDAEIRESESRREAECAVLDIKARIAAAYLKYETAVTIFKMNVASARAIADAAYDLQVEKIKQQIQFEMAEVSVVEKRKEVELEEMMKDGKLKELRCGVIMRANAEAYGVVSLAEGSKTVVVEEARAVADGRKLVAAAEAAAMQRVAAAEVGRTLLKAGVLRECGEPALVQLVLQVAARVMAMLLQGACPT